MLNKIFEGGWAPGSKTYLTVFLGIAGAVGGYLTGEMSLVEMFQVVGPLLGLGFLRGGVANSK